MALTGLREKKYKPPRVVLYAAHGVGKTTFGANAPNPVFVTTEDGADNIEGLDDYEIALDWNSFISNLKEVATAEHDKDTVVIDTINGACDLCSKHVCNTLFGGNWKKFLGWGGNEGYGATVEELRQLLTLTDKCRNRGMLVLMLAHSGLHNVKHPKEDDYQMWAPAMDKRLWAAFSRNCDVIMRADYDYVVSEKEGSTRKRASAGNTRMLYCSGSAAEEGKSRAGYELPESMEFNYDVFAENLGKTDGLVVRVKNLMIALLTKEEQTAAMVFAGCEKLVDAPATKLKQLLNKLLIKQSEKNEKGETE